MAEPGRPVTNLVSEQPDATEPTFGEKVKALFVKLEPDLTAAGVRVFARQLVKGLREPLIAWLSARLDSNDTSLRAKIAAGLQTEMGEAFVTALLALAINTAVMERPADSFGSKLAKELRVKAMFDTGDAVADLLFAPVRSAIVDALRKVETPILPVASSNVSVPDLELVPNAVPLQVMKG